MQLIDAHCHLEAQVFEGRLGPVLEEARQAGVSALITAATRPGEWPVSKAIAAQYPQVAFAWGIHPWFVEEAHRQALEPLREARRHGAVAIGEIGLDAKIGSPSLGLQVELFEAQLAIACAIALPVVMHCRGAFNELLASLRRVGVPGPGGMVHAFSGSAEIAEECIALGLSFSMGASLSYRKGQKRAKVIEHAYPNHLLLETDSPDMPPVQAEKPNVPANIRYNLSGLAAYVDETEEAVAAVTTQNAVRLFNLETDVWKSRGGAGPSD